MRRSGFAIAMMLLLGCGDDAAMPHDAAARDAPADAPDAAVPDAAGVDAVPARRLSEMGLYQDIATGTLADGVVEYTPAYTLWADGATKRRFFKLPPGTQIDTSNMDHWVFPVGTKFFKEFSLGGRALETRMVERTGPSAYDYDMVAFAWLPDGSDAIEAPDGADDVLGTDHDIPSRQLCGRCHIGENGRILGFSAIQLSKPEGNGPTLASLAQAGLLSNPPPAGADYSVPGDATTAAALGYLHANCGHCHNPQGYAWFVSQTLRLDVGDRTPDATTIWRTTVHQPMNEFNAPGITYRIAPGDPTHSGIVYRMSHRGDQAQMPPIATEHIDETGIAAVTAWIVTLQ